MSTLETSLTSTISPLIKSRNSFFDAIFYDISKLNPEETAELSIQKDREGSIILVPPASSGRKIIHFPTSQLFLAAHQKDIKAVAIAGVGSSALGTAALARNVANAFDIDVAGIVSGYGVADLMTEAMGGWFIYGAGDRIRHSIRAALHSVDEIFNPENSSTEKSKKAANEKISHVSSDIGSLIEILKSEPPNLRVIVGHSKGDLLLDFALEKFVASQKNNDHRLYNELDIITFGAITDIPPQFKKVHQFIGQIDWFGGLNSQFSVPHTTVPNAWHHLNTAFPCSMGVEKILKEAKIYP